MLFLSEQIHYFSQTNTDLISTRTTGSHTCRSKPDFGGRYLYSSFNRLYESYIHHARAPPHLSSTDPVYVTQVVFPQIVVSSMLALARKEDKETYQ